MPCPAATTGVCTRVLNGDPCGIGSPQALAALNLFVQGAADSLILSWDPVAGETVRIVVRNKETGASAEAIAARLDGTATIPNLTPNEVYYVSIRAEEVVGSDNQYVYDVWTTIKALVNEEWDSNTKLVTHRTKALVFNSKLVLMK